MLIQGLGLLCVKRKLLKIFFWFSEIKEIFFWISKEKNVKLEETVLICLHGRHGIQNFWHLLFVLFEYKCTEIQSSNIFKSDILNIQKVRFRSNIQCFEFFGQPKSWLKQLVILFPIDKSQNPRVGSKILAKCFFFWPDTYILLTLITTRQKKFWFKSRIFWKMSIQGVL